MQRILFLAVFFCQKTNGVYGIGCANKALVSEKFDDITSAAVDNPLEDLAMRK